MDINSIRCQIDKAIWHEGKTSYLSRQLCHFEYKMHHTIQTPDENVTGTLINYVKEYIRHVPSFLKALSETSKEVGIDPFVLPFLTQVGQYFLAPPHRIVYLQGLDKMMHCAYMSHRILEEVNEQYINTIGVNLFPLDVIHPNLIIHHLIGEDLANKLDELVSQDVRTMLKQCKLPISESNYKHSDAWSSHQDNWLSLFSNNEVTLDFLTGKKHKKFLSEPQAFACN